MQVTPVMEVRSKISLNLYQSELKQELEEILSWWMHNTHDAVNGGFIGRVDEVNRKWPDAPKGAVLNSRILWAFSSGYELTQNPDHLHLARVAYHYLSSNLRDHAYGGVYWTINAQGQPLDSKKQVYAMSFAIYGCCAYYRVSNNEAAKDMAIELYRQIERYSFDPQYGGYLEAFTRDWQPMADLRLSEKDANEKKTMNTHLHVLEAYTSLCQVWPDKILKQQLSRLLAIFTEHIIDPESGHLALFFDETWKKRSQLISFGHDIEAAWLLPAAAEALADQALLAEIKKCAQMIAVAAAKGLDKDGGLWYEYDGMDKQFNREKHWWVQAEAMVGFFDQWQDTGDEVWLQRSHDCWQYVKKSIKDDQYGEWLWGRDELGAPMAGQDKAGIWKCPYHNTRACIEIIKRIARMQK